MDKKCFKKNVLKPLERWSLYGEEINNLNTKLIGHAPHVAPKAYVHVIYAPLDYSNLQEFVERIGRPVPSQFKSFLSYANGLSIFLDEIRVMGYVPLQRKSSAGVYNYPSNIIVPNVSARIRGLSDGAVVVGFYKADGSYVSLEGGKAVRFDSRGTGEIIQEWTDFDTWLSSEIAKFNEEQWGIGQ